MTESDRLHELLRAAFPEPGGRHSRDVWPAVVARLAAPVKPSWPDILLAAAIVTALALIPGGLFLLAYHL